MKRAEIVVFDETSWLSEEQLQVLGAFTAQNKDFKLGGDIDISTLPKEFPNQLLYASSASSVDTPFYSYYRNFSKRMLLGDKNYFVADINCDIVIRATKGGKVYPASLLTQEKIDTAMRENREKALREYKNIFTTEGGDGQIIKRAQIVKNSVVRPPLLFNDTNQKKFAIAYDPARSMDNSVVLVGEYYLDEQVGWKMNIVNCVSFVDLQKKLKTPMRTPEQIEALKQIILDYNGDQVADYENIIALLIDAGSGGSGVNIADYLMPDWKSKQGITHKGLIDKDYSSDYVSRFPNAVNKIKLLQPTKYKSDMYEALIEMIGLDLITFPSDYDNKGYLTILSDDITNTDAQMYKLSPDEEVALKQIDALKEEVVNMYRYKSNTAKDRFDLSQDKQGKLHDDRSYCLSMLAWQLYCLRREHITKKEKKKVSLNNICSIKKPNIYGKK